MLPDDAEEKQARLRHAVRHPADGYHGTELADMQLGDSVVVFGAGPVGLMAAISANLKGTDHVLVVDHQPDGLELAEKLGAIPVDNSAGDAVEQVLEATRGEGADKGVDAVGYQADDHTGAEQSGLTSNSLIQAVRPTGRIGVVGVFILEDPTASDELAQQGRFAFDFGTFFLKGQSMGTARPTSSSTTGRCAT